MSRLVDIAHREDLVEGPIAAAGPRALWRDMRPVLASVAATLIVGLGLTVLLLRPTIAQTHAKARAHFDHLAEQLTTQVQRRLDLPLYALKGIRSLLAASGSVDRSEFKRWVLSDDIPSEFSGALGLGFIQRVMRKDLDRFIATERNDRAPNFTVRTSGDAPDLFVVKFVEPLGSNRAALGYEVGSEPIRRAAVERAMSTGEPTLTGRITLLQDEQQRAGFLYLLPIYRNGAAPTTQQQREEALVGLVYMRS